MPKRGKHLKPEKPLYLKGHARQIWRVVDGAVLDAFKNHPDYLTHKGSRNQTARRSVVKRVTGSVLSYLVQAKWGRSGASCRRL
jgi:hypothetical protein